MNYTDATLLLIAHGSTVNAESAAAPMEHAEALRERKLFHDVRVCFWKQAPFIRETVAQVQSHRVFAVPLFLSEGYFTLEVIPRELGLHTDGTTVQRFAERRHGTLFYCQPIGTSDAMTDVILSRAAKVVDTFGPSPPPDATALCLAAHGTDKNPESRRAAEWHVDRIRALHRYAEAHAVFMEETPRISDAPQLTRAANLVVVPFFISEGMHSREDVPVLLGEDAQVVQQRMRSGKPTFINPTDRAGKRIWYSQPVGTAPLVREVILQRVREAVRHS